MTLRFPAVAAVLVVLGLAAENTAVAQPIAPPRRPTFSSYGGLFGPGGGYYGYGSGGGGYGFGYGYGGPAFGGGGWGAGNGFGAIQQQQNLMLQQQLNLTNQNIANLQTFIATGVNPNFPITGRGAVFNNLGHWYPSATNGGGGGMMMGGGMYGGRTAGSGIPLGGGSGTGGNTARTSGGGIGIQPPK